LREWWLWSRGNGAGSDKAVMMDLARCSGAGAAGCDKMQELFW